MGDLPLPSGTPPDSITDLLFPEHDAAPWTASDLVEVAAHAAVAGVPVERVLDCTDPLEFEVLVRVINRALELRAQMTGGGE